MYTFLNSILPKIGSFSLKLDRLQNLVDEPWVLVNSEEFTKIIFKKDLSLIYSTNGNVFIGKWELLNKAHSILIQYNNTAKLLNDVFLDDSVLILKIDGSSDFFILINQNKIPSLNLEDYLKNKYLVPTPVKNQPIISIQRIETDKGILEVFLKNSNSSSKGDTAFIDGKIAPDGKYYTGWPKWLNYIELKNGLIINQL